MVYYFKRDDKRWCLDVYRRPPSSAPDFSTSVSTLTVAISPSVTKRAPSTHSLGERRENKWFQLVLWCVQEKSSQQTASARREREREARVSWINPFHWRRRGLIIWNATLSPANKHSSHDSRRNAFQYWIFQSLLGFSPLIPCIAANQDLFFRQSITLTYSL